MNRYFFLELLDENPALLGAVVRFNAPAQPADALPLLSAAENHADLRSVIASHRRAGAGFWDFSEESRCLALMPSDIVSRLARTAAAAIYAEEIAHTVQKSAVLALREFFGSALIDYALSRGRWQAGASIRAVFANMQDAEKPLDERCAEAAVLSVASLKAGWPQTLQDLMTERWATADLPRLGLPALIAGDERLALWQFMKKLIYRELGAPWTNYFV